MKILKSFETIPVILAVTAGLVPLADAQESAAVPAKKSDPQSEITSVPAEKKTCRNVPAVDRCALFGVAVERKILDEKEFGLNIIFVSKDTPADEIGLEIDDTLLAIDGQKLFFPNQFAALVRTYKPGDKISVEYKRAGGDTQTRELTLAGRERESFSRQRLTRETGKIKRECVPEDDVRIIINGREIKLSQESEWRDRITVTPEAIIIRKTSGIPAEMRRMVDSIREKIPDPEVILRDVKAQYEDAQRLVQNHVQTFSQVFVSKGTTVMIFGDDKTREITVRTKDGELFRGPCSTQEEIDAIPAKVKKIIDENIELKPL